MPPMKPTDCLTELSAVLRIMVVCAGLAAGSVQAAQDPDAEAFMKCAALTDESARLACFDQAARQQTPTPQVEPSEPAVAEDTTTAPAAPAARPDVAVMPAAAPTAVAIEPSASPSSTASSASTATAESVQPAAAAVPEAGTPAVGPAPPEEEVFVGPPQEAAGEFTGVVERVAEQPRGEHVVYLENGQVWQENVRSSYFPVETGDTITIEKRRFGGYRLITESGRAYEMKRLR
jgi:hypothetical protein